MPTFFVEPSPRRGEISQGVIAKIIEQHERLLPQFGWDETDDWQAADLCVGHLSAKCPRLDAFHLHGLYPTGTLKLPRACWEGNASIIDNLRRTRHVIAVSEWVADIVRRDMRADPYVVGHGIDLAAWAKVRRSKDEWANAPYVLWNKTRTLGVCDPSPVLALAQSMPDVQFVTTFLPDGAVIPKNVHVTGLLEPEEMWRVVKGATVYLATTMETFGIGILEAMASGVPVVGYNWGALPAVIGDTGLLVEHDDTAALADAVRKALDKEERKPLVEAALERVKLYEWSDVVGGLADVYSRCLPAPETSPKVTVVVPCYNYAQYVGDAIGSVLKQTFTDFELIVVDDGSTDHSVERIKEAIAGDDRARLIEQENTGVSEARNHAIREAKGEYIACLDADDMMEPGFLHACLLPLEADRRLAITYTALAFIDKDGNPIPMKSEWPWAYDASKGLEINQVPTCCLFRKDWWQRCGGYKTRFLSGRGAGQEDGDLWFNMLGHGGGALRVTDQPLFLYRFHALQATRNFKEYWSRTLYKDWYPWAVDGQRHPFASQLLVPEQASLSVYHYDRPRVAVVIPVGPNHRKSLVDAVGSVISQSYRQWELIIVNDSGELLDTSAWPFARVLDTEMKGMGPGHARNLGTSLATAPLVVYLDADDVLQPMFIEQTLRAWLETGGWVYTDFYYIDINGAHKVYDTPNWNIERLWEKGIAAVTALYPIEAWREVGGFDEEIQHEDWEFHIKITKAGWCGTRLAEPLITYRHDTGSRREEGIKAKGFIDIKKRYSREVLMGCNCGKGGGRKTVAAHRAQAPAPPVQQGQTKAAPAPLPETIEKGKPGADYILMRYVGKSDTELLFKGRDGRQYIFSTRRMWNWVHPLDVQRLVVKSVLQRYDPSQMRGTGDPLLVVPRNA